MSLLSLFGFTTSSKAKAGRPPKTETRGRPSKAANAEKEEPLRHEPRSKQQQQVKVKKGRINWSLSKNQERLKDVVDEWNAQEEKVRTERRT